MTQQTQLLTELATWQIDAAHTNVEFSVRHMMIATVKGRFSDVYGSIIADPDDPASGSVDVTINTASLDTGNDMRDKHLRSGDFFDAERFPNIRFTSTSITTAGNGRFRVTGDLTIRDVTRAVTLDAEFYGVHPDPYGGARAGVHVSAEIDRTEFGLTWNQAIEGGGVVVGPKVKIALDIEAVRS
jgi:polyisoprenoid-binding protein YceI